MTEITDVLQADNLINPDTPPVIISGQVSGTATLWQPFGGTAYKKVIIFLSNFRTGSNGTQGIVLPVAFSNGCTGFSGDIGANTIIGGVQLLSDGVPQNVVMPTTLATTGGNRIDEQTFYGMTLINCATAFDTILFLGGSHSASNGFIVLEGV